MEFKETLDVKLRIVGENEYPFCEIGKLTHGRPAFRVWLSHRLVEAKQDTLNRIADLQKAIRLEQSQERIERIRNRIRELRENNLYQITFPARGYIKITEKGNLVLKPSERHWTFLLRVPCGYRGSSSLQIESDVEFQKKFEQYHSPRGSLGISEGALVTVREEQLPVKIRWHRTGRLYGAPAEGIALVHIDRIEELEGVSDLDELNELASELEG